MGEKHLKCAKFIIMVMSPLRPGAGTPVWVMLHLRDSGDNNVKCQRLTFEMSTR